MCGICGKVFVDPRNHADVHLIRQMAEAIRHRGPDENGEYVQGAVGLGHRRLSIIDLKTGQQPMSNHRGDLRIVYNGEVYNFREARKDLQHAGYVFRTHSDTEVILQLYDKYGADCVTRLRGMFAFAIWDARRQRLFLARDRVGQKPLFYTITPHFIAFASEIKALLQDPEIQSEINVHALSDYLTYQYVPPPETMFQNIFQLPPAHTLIWEQGHVSIQRYWDLWYQPKQPLSAPEAVERVWKCFKKAVKMRMMSDVPIGAFLSGGIDSSLVVAAMAQFSPVPVNTFSIGFQEESFNELPYARLVAQRFQTKHHEFMVKSDAIHVLPELIRHFDEPFGDCSAIPTYYLAHMTGQHVKVVLNGDGGDESFGGYLRYLGYMMLRQYGKLPHAFRRYVLVHLVGIIASIARAIPVPDKVRIALRRLTVLNNLSLEPEQAHYINTLVIFLAGDKSKILSRELQYVMKDRDSIDYMGDYFSADNAEHVIDKMLYADVMTYLPGDLLVKVDRMTMAHGVEARSPFLDHHLMELAARLVPRQKLHGRQLKVLLKQLGEQKLPEEILRRSKQGFAVPLGQWFRGELREFVWDTLGTAVLSRDGILQQTEVQRMLEGHLAGRQDNKYKIWLVLNLELWYRMFFDGSISGYSGLR